MSAALDIAGFVTASKQLRQQAGGQVVFSVPQDPVWPDGTRINPDTGEPYNSMVKRTNAEFVTVTKTVLLISKEASPLRPQADVHFAEAGQVTGMDIILDLDADDYGDVQAASEFEANGKHYLVEEWKPNSLGPTVYRWLVYGAEK